MSASLDKAQQILRRNRCRAVIAQRVEIQWRLRQHRLIQYYPDFVFGIVHQREGRHRARGDPQRREQ